MIDPTQYVPLAATLLAGVAGWVARGPLRRAEQANTEAESEQTRIASASTAFDLYERAIVAVSRAEEAREAARNQASDMRREMTVVRSELAECVVARDSISRRVNELELKFANAIAGASS